ncbi:MAG: hypothetical protein NXI09_10060 [Bacteroidetes bacterium]|nr:hypothetical protein [Bacteroidota bacterium]
MEITWKLLLAAAIFSTLIYFYSKALRAYVADNYGENWLSVWGNKLYFWQSLIFSSLASMLIVMYLLRWLNVLSF